ncbi:hypothetical protein H6G83_20615 [Anabaena azotica FACHB-119]|uniref:Uncharacterized protein n=1 Tax=Anabaena azotica FACHB-119 TaxID=947527 RepID=A0ABR8D8U3_9NOST|nr:hypothetical protein [Anabaena azotica FACHB-119]
MDESCHFFGFVQKILCHFTKAIAPKTPLTSKERSPSVIVTILRASF